MLSFGLNHTVVVLCDTFIGVDVVETFWEVLDLGLGFCENFGFLDYCVLV